MTDQAALASKVEPGISQLRCIACGAVGDEGAKSVRCAQCGDLLEVVYPGWKTGAGTRAAALDAAGLKKLWLQRRTSWNPLDESGVWRFREILPALHDWNHVITLREGNTPLYELPSCGCAAGVEHLFAKHQGMNPTGSFKDTGMTAATSFARQGGLRLDGQYVCFDGGLRRACRNA
jgi:threonine synthase